MLLPLGQGWGPEQTLEGNSEASPTIPIGSSTSGYSKVPWTTGSQDHRITGYQDDRIPEPQEVLSHLDRAVVPERNF